MPHSTARTAASLSPGTGKNDSRPAIGTNGRGRAFRNTKPTGPANHWLSLSVTQSTTSATPMIPPVSASASVGTRRRNPRNAAMASASTFSGAWIRNSPRNRVRHLRFSTSLPPNVISQAQGCWTLRQRGRGAISFDTRSAPAGSIRFDAARLPRLITLVDQVFFDGQRLGHKSGGLKHILRLAEGGKPDALIMLGGVKGGENIHAVLLPGKKYPPPCYRASIILKTNGGPHD